MSRVESEAPEPAGQSSVEGEDASTSAPGVEDRGSGLEAVEPRGCTCSYCGAAIDWDDWSGWLVHGAPSVCRQTPTGRHRIGGEADGYGPSLKERAELMGTAITVCPECTMTSVLHVPGLYPACQCCEWTGWERDVVAGAARPR